MVERIIPIQQVYEYVPVFVGVNSTTLSPGAKVHSMSNSGISMVRLHPVMELLLAEIVHFTGVPA